MRNVGENLKNHDRLKKTVLLLATACLSILGALVVPSEGKLPSDRDYLTVKNCADDCGRAILAMNHNINAEIFDLPKVVALPMDLSPAPVPNPAGFVGDTYSDDTITVKCSRERIALADKTVTANFAEVTVTSPTQLRTAFAGGSYGTSKREYAAKLSADNHAVVAVNADFYNYRAEGIIIRQGTMYRNQPFGIDTLFIDSDGNFTVMDDYEAVESGFLDSHRIYQSLAFGPVLVQDGNSVHKSVRYHSVSCGQYVDNPRTAIGQLGELHYLLCTIDGRSADSRGCTTNELADIMAAKGCVTAYNLDGGQSTTMVFGGKVYNAVSNGGERAVSDIVYFATAEASSAQE